MVAAASRAASALPASPTTSAGACPPCPPVAPPPRRTARTTGVARGDAGNGDDATLAADCGAAAPRGRETCSYPSAAPPPSSAPALSSLPCARRIKLFIDTDSIYRDASVEVAAADCCVRPPVATTPRRIRLDDATALAASRHRPAARARATLCAAASLPPPPLKPDARAGRGSGEARRSAASKCS